MELHRGRCLQCAHMHGELNTWERLISQFNGGESFTTHCIGPSVGEEGRPSDLTQLTSTLLSRTVFSQISGPGE